MKMPTPHIVRWVGTICLLTLFSCTQSPVVKIPEKGKYESILKDSIYNEHQNMSFKFIKPFFLEFADKEAFSYIYQRNVEELYSEELTVSFLIFDKSKMSFEEFKEKKNYMNKDRYSKYFIEEGVMELNNKYTYTLMDNMDDAGKKIKIKKIWLQFFTELPDRNVRITISQYGFKDEFMDKNYDFALAILQSVVFH